MRSIITVTGYDKPGIIAKVSGVLFDMNCNILDINQTVLREEFFAMTMLVDIDGMNVAYDELADRLARCGQQMELDIRIQREELFKSMHRI